MDIILLGLDKKFVRELSSELKNEMSYISFKAHSDVCNFLNRNQIDFINILLVEIHIQNFESCFTLTDKMIKKNPNIIIIFILIVRAKFA